MGNLKTDDRHSTQGECHGKTKVGIWVGDISISQGTPKIAPNPPEGRQKHGTAPSLPSEGTSPANILKHGLLTFGNVRPYISVIEFTLFVVTFCSQSTKRIQHYQNVKGYWLYIVK